MAVEILPQNTITPALKDVFGQMSNINAMKMQEETRKRNELADLTAISLQNISANDNIYLQQEKEKFISEAAKSYGANKGYLPYEIQADLNTKKSNIIMEAKASEEWKKQYEDVVKQMSTSDKIDKEKTAANLQSMMLNPDGTPKPPSARPNPYNAVSLNFDTNEYINKTLNKALDKNTKEEGGRIITTEDLSPDDIFSQIKSWIPGNIAFGQKLAEEARDANMGLDDYIMNVKVPAYVVANKSDRPKSKGNTYVFGGGVPAGGIPPSTSGEATAVRYKDVDNNYRTASYTPQNVYAIPQAINMTFDGADIVYGDNVLKTKTAPVPTDIQSVKMYPAVWVEKEKRWAPITDQNLGTIKPENIVSKPFFYGTTDVKDSEGVSSKIPVFIPATESRKQLFNAALGQKTGKQTFDINKIDEVKTGVFGPPSKKSQPAPAKTPKLSDYLNDPAYKGYTEAQIKKAYKDQYGIELK